MSSQRATKATDFATRCSRCRRVPSSRLDSVIHVHTAAETYASAVAELVGPAASRGDAGDICDVCDGVGGGACAIVLH
jgi:hypothetical protein